MVVLKFKHTFRLPVRKEKKEDNVPLSADKQTRNEIKLGEIVECFYLAYSRYIPKMIIKNS